MIVSFKWSLACCCINSFMDTQQCTQVLSHLLSQLPQLLGSTAPARTYSRMRRFHRFQENCIISLSKQPRKLKFFVWPSNICAGVNLTLRLLAETQREGSSVTSLPAAILAPSTIVHWQYVRRSIIKLITLFLHNTPLPSYCTHRTHKMEKFFPLFSCKCSFCEKITRAQAHLIQQFLITYPECWQNIQSYRF